MGSFSSAYPVAYHVLPLPAWRGIVRSRALVAQPAERWHRPTTAAVDHALGFDGFVHFYLAQGSHRIHQLPILQAQLQAARTPPFPHVVLELTTDGLDDSEVVICNWNLAVSRPGVPGVAKGGNWTRGTDPRRIRRVWDAFRRSRPDANLARGFFSPGCAVPILTGEAIRENLGLLRKAPRNLPELLVGERVELERMARLLVFSDFDADLARRLAPDFPIRRETYPGYRGSAVPSELRARLAAFMEGGNVEGSWDFDSVRSTG